MKKWSFLILFAFLLTACNLPFNISINANTPNPNQTAAPAQTVVVVTATPEPATAQPTTPPAPQFNGVEKNLGGVYFVLPDCLASDASGVIVPEENPGADLPYFAYNPAYRKISLSGYPLSGKFWDPMVQVYPVAAYVQLVPDIQQTIDAMNTLLQTQPTSFTSSIPLLPLENAAQIFRAQVGYLNFQNGKGVGFLTEYAQYSAPVNNTDLFYTYQGLTNDGKYWISMFLPVNAAYLQPSFTDPTIPADGIPAPDMMAPNADQAFKTYYDQMVQKLNGTPADQFTPSLTCISQFVQSFNVGD